MSDWIFGLLWAGNYLLDLVTPEPEPKAQAKKHSPQSPSVHAINQTINELAALKKNLERLKGKRPDLMNDPQFAEIVFTLHDRFHNKALTDLLSALPEGEEYDE